MTLGAWARATGPSAFQRVIGCLLGMPQASLQIQDSKIPYLKANKATCQRHPWHLEGPKWLGKLNTAEMSLDQPYGQESPGLMLFWIFYCECRFLVKCSPCENAR